MSAARAFVPVFTVLGAATVYEALIALQAIEPGSEPGQEYPGEVRVLSLAILAMLAGVAIAVAAPRARAAALLAPAATAFLLARFHTFDPYYLPTLRRASDGGVLSPLLVYALVGLAICAAVLTRVRPRAGIVLTVPVVLACGFFAYFAQVGH